MSGLCTLRACELSWQSFQRQRGGVWRKLEHDCDDTIRQSLHHKGQHFIFPLCLQVYHQVFDEWELDNLSEISISIHFHGWVNHRKLCLTMSIMILPIIACFLMPFRLPNFTDSWGSWAQCVPNSMMETFHMCHPVRVSDSRDMEGGVRRGEMRGETDGIIVTFN